MVIDDDETQVPDEDEAQVPESQGNSVLSSEDIQRVATGLIALIERRWLSYDEDKIYSICSLFDPRFKDFCFFNSALVSAKRLLPSVMRATSANPVNSSRSVAINAEDDQEDSPVKKKKCLWGSFDEELKKKKSTQLSASQDKNSAEYINRKEDLLEWWKGNKNCYPILAQVAREYLAIPSMSTPSERIFSAAGYISSKQRFH